MSPDISRINPAQGLKRIFSITGTAKLGFGLFKVFVISGVAATVIWSRHDEVLRASTMDVEQLGHFIADLVLKIVLWAAWRWYCSRCWTTGCSVGSTSRTSR